MNVSLTQELDQFVAGKVECDRYNSASEVVCEALRLLEKHTGPGAHRLPPSMRNSLQGSNHWIVESTLSRGQFANAFSKSPARGGIDRDYTAGAPSGSLGGAPSACSS